MYGFEKALASIVVHYNTSGRGYMLKSDLDIEEKDLLILESKNLIRLTRYIDGNARINLTPDGWLYYESNLSGGNSNGCAETESKGKVEAFMDSLRAVKKSFDDTTPKT